jgi:hypothetical protein
MGNRAISDERIHPVIQAFPRRYRPSCDRFSPGGGVVGALGFRVGPVLFSIAGLGYIVENNIGTCETYLPQLTATFMSRHERVAEQLDWSGPLK